MRRLKGDKASHSVICYKSKFIIHIFKIYFCNFKTVFKYFLFKILFDMKKKKSILLIKKNCCKK